MGAGSVRRVGSPPDARLVITIDDSILIHLQRYAAYQARVGSPARAFVRACRSSRPHPTSSGSGRGRRILVCASTYKAMDNVLLEAAAAMPGLLPAGAGM